MFAALSDRSLVNSNIRQCLIEFRIEPSIFTQMDDPSKSKLLAWRSFLSTSVQFP